MLPKNGNQLPTNLHPLFFQSLPSINLLHHITSTLKRQPGSPSTPKMEMHPRIITYPHHFGALTHLQHIIHFCYCWLQEHISSLYENFVYNRKEALCSSCRKNPMKAEGERDFYVFLKMSTWRRKGFVSAGNWHPTNLPTSMPAGVGGSSFLSLAFLSFLVLRSISTPAALKGLGKPFNAALEKNPSHPSPIPRPWLPGLFKLPAPLTILAGERCACCAHIPGPHPLAIQWIVPLLGIIGKYSWPFFRVEEPVCK